MKSLNIYIWGEEKHNIHHLMDYVRSHRSDDDFSFFFINKKVNGLSSRANTYVFDYPKYVNEEWVNIIYSAAQKIGAESITIHTAIKDSEKINFLLVSAFYADIRKGLNFSLNVYEADLNDIAYRKEFNALLKKGLQYNTFMKQMKMNLVSKDKKWPAVCNYLFNGVVETQYFFHPFFLNINNPFFTSAHHHYVNHNFDAYSETEVAMVLTLLGVKSESISLVKKIAAQKRSVFFVDDGNDFVLGNEDKDDCLIQEVVQDKAEFVFLLNYKGSINNGRRGTVNFVKLPEDITLELLSAAGVAIDNVYGLCSLSLFSLGINKVKKIFFHEDDKHADNIRMRELLASNHCDNIPAVFFNEAVNKINKEGGDKHLFALGESMGDGLFAIGSLHAFRDNHPGDVILLAPKIYHNLLRLSPLVDDVWDIENLDERMKQEIYIAKYRGHFHSPCSGKHIFAAKHQIDSIISSYDEMKVSNSKKEMTLSLESVNKDKVDNFLSVNNLTSKVVLIHPNEGVPNRAWPKSSWEELIGRFIKDGWSVVLIGANTNFYSHKKTVTIENSRVFNAIDLFSMGETVYLMSKSSLLVACDSGPVALAGASDIAICAIYSVVPGRYRLPYRRGQLGWNALAVDLSCRYGHCAKYYPASMKGTFDAWCPNNKSYACMQNFKVDDFYQQIDKFVQSEKFIDNLLSSR